jgi:hypothetical protein
VICGPNHSSPGIGSGPLGRPAYGVPLAEPAAGPGVEPRVFDGEPDAELLQRFVAVIGDRPLEAHIAREFTLDQIPAAHHALLDHHLGKLAIAIG